MTLVNVVVSCSNRKKSAPEPDLQFRRYQGQPIETAAEAWGRGLAIRGRWTAEDLYAGDHWSIAKEIKDVPEVKLWICSAGYGLLSPDALVRSYAATFSSGHDDSIGNSLQARKKWWALLADNALQPSDGRWASFRQLFKHHTHERWLVVLSKSYLDVVVDDLASALSCLESREQLSVLSVGAQLPDGLSDRALPCSSAFERLESLSGTRVSLNVRIARHLLKRNAVRSHAAWTQLLEQQMPHEEPNQPRRQQVSDQELMQFIREECSRRSHHSATGLLRVWRSERNLACEQKRFKALYQAVKLGQIN